MIALKGEKAVFEIVPLVERIFLLKQKLVEEANELLAANEKDAPEELADVLEVIEALQQCFNLDKVHAIKKRKASKNGSFKFGYVLNIPVKP